MSLSIYDRDQIFCNKMLAFLEQNRDLKKNINLINKRYNICNECKKHFNGLGCSAYGCMTKENNRNKFYSDIANPEKNCIVYGKEKW